MYEAPFEHVRQHIKSKRLANRREAYGASWWIHMEPRPAMRRALRGLDRYLVTPTVAKHHLFVWIKHPTLPDHQLIAFARSDDYFFGVVHSRPHELWSRRKGSQLREAESGHRYTPAETFETFPLPWAPGSERLGDAQVRAIAEAAETLVRERDPWLNRPNASEAQLKRRTLTNLYNQRPEWLEMAHRRLDAAALDACGWPHDLTDEDILERLLALNLTRANQAESSSSVEPIDRRPLDRRAEDSVPTEQAAVPPTRDRACRGGTAVG